ncbi:MAG: S-adenosylmethionine:tRNA ribosyltransferase-isomerase [Pseudomonadota bacterium]|jgi:S-adenosylmethionine:tRNA ribosyltransferase-isomerase|nr:tRNA preQ1(34) S-adenosylmethionine ribosyltransferase-isomerase QueA [Burkholderiales bacterium]MBP9768799.1 tRNA preQ1(34) S-adenosylmethionine ribosyltransferase-isomerase QueA [Burkholderiales bacterium]MDQ5948727.1 S-adenosylmethionine:tRNA ribosyltransferase-isomerase [Pseudomonadota bacterium]
MNKHNNLLQLSDFDYHLPEQLIACQPLVNRDDSRLLVVDETPQDRQFKHILDYLNAGDLLVLNNTRVVKARLFGHKPTGGKVEVMLERVINNHEIIAHVGTSKAIKIGMQIELPAGISMQVIERMENIFRLRILQDIDIYAYLEQHGNLPLPPYMQRQAALDDETRYQTVFAQHNGSVAAPTAGLHFTPELLAQIRAKGVQISYVTLHVGSGTFKPVSVENIAEHKMHSEVFEINHDTVELIKQTKLAGGKVIAVGTTSLRTLESVAKRGLYPQRGETDIFITPGFKFELVDKLITNFHLPKSTLLMLVAAFSGKTQIDASYQHAIQNNYRFFSYGDAMLLTRQD